MEDKYQFSEDIDWNIVGYILSSKVRFNILKLLEKRMLTPTQIKDELGLSITHISNELKSLRKKELVECINPTVRKGRIYKLTGLGLSIYEITENIKMKK